MAKRKLSRWQLLVKRVASENPKLKFGQVLRKAKSLYKKGGSSEEKAVGSSASPRKTHKIRRIGKIAKKHGKRRSFTLPMALIAGFAGSTLGGSNVGTEDTTISHLKNGEYDKAATRIVANYTGYNMQLCTWNWKELNLLPLLFGAGVHWVAGKFGINAGLGRAKVPIVRV